MQFCQKAMERFANGRKSPANTSINAEQTCIHDTEPLPNTLSVHSPPSLISMLKNSLRYKVDIVKVQESRWRVSADEANGRGHYQSLQNARTLKEPFYTSTAKFKPKWRREAVKKALNWVMCVRKDPAGTIQWRQSFRGWRALRVTIFPFHDTTRTLKWNTSSYIFYLVISSDSIKWKGF